VRKLSTGSALCLAGIGLISLAHLDPADVFNPGTPAGTHGYPEPEAQESRVEPPPEELLERALSGDLIEPCVSHLQKHQRRTEGAAR
jgi:hypothetical protein